MENWPTWLYVELCLFASVSHCNRVKYCYMYFSSLFLLKATEPHSLSGILILGYI